MISSMKQRIVSSGEPPQTGCLPEKVTVSVIWDAEAQVYVASSDTVPGLATYGDTFEELRKKLEVMVPEMLEDNLGMSEDDAHSVRYLVCFDPAATELPA